MTYSDFADFKCGPSGTPCIWYQKVNFRARPHGLLLPASGAAEKVVSQSTSVSIISQYLSGVSWLDNKTNRSPDGHTVIFCFV